MLHMRRFLFGAIATVTLGAVASSPALAQCQHGMRSGGSQPQQPSQQLLFQQTQQQLLTQQLLQQQLLQQQLSQQSQLQQSGLLPLGSPAYSQATFQQISTQNETGLQASLKDPRSQVRRLAAQAIGKKGLPLQDDLISLLTDPARSVRQAARHSLVKLAAAEVKRRAVAAHRSSKSRRIDFGPSASAGKTAQGRAAQKWREWWDNQTLARAALANGSG